MDKFVIQGGVKLEGEVRISGAKNAALPLLAAMILADTPITLKNVPDLKDVRTLVKLIGGLGITMSYLLLAQHVFRHLWVFMIFKNVQV